MNKVWAKSLNLFGGTFLFTNFQFTVWLSAHYFSNDEFWFDPPCLNTPAVFQTCIAKHESNGIDIIIALIVNPINPLGEHRLDLVLELKVRSRWLWGHWGPRCDSDWEQNECSEFHPSFLSKHLVLLENLCNLSLKTSMKTQSVVVEQRVQTSSGHHGEPPWQRERREDPLQDETCWTGKCVLTVDEI